MSTVREALSGEESASTAIYGRLKEYCSEYDINLRTIEPLSRPRFVLVLFGFINADAKQTQTPQALGGKDKISTELLVQKTGTYYRGAKEASLSKLQIVNNAFTYKAELHQGEYRGVEEAVQLREAVDTLPRPQEYWVDQLSQATHELVAISGMAISAVMKADAARSQAH